MSKKRIAELEKLVREAKTDFAEEIVVTFAPCKGELVELSRKQKVGKLTKKEAAKLDKFTAEQRDRRFWERESLTWRASTVPKQLISKAEVKRSRRKASGADILSVSSAMSYYQFPRILSTAQGKLLQEINEKLGELQYEHGYSVRVVAEAPSSCVWRLRDDGREPVGPVGPIPSAGIRIE